MGRERLKIRPVLVWVDSRKGGSLFRFKRGRGLNEYG